MQGTSAVTGEGLREGSKELSKLITYNITHFTLQ